MNRKVTFGGGCSLDNFIAGNKDEVDWLIWNDEVAEITKEFWKSIDTVVMGRKTYEVAARSAGSSGAYPGIKGFICSRTLKKSPDPNSALASDAVQLVRDLKQQEGKGICIMGGGDLANSLFEAGLIDEVGLNIHPVLLGSGIPLFHHLDRKVRLVLKECRELGNGCVLVRYEVKP